MTNDWYVLLGFIVLAIVCWTLGFSKHYRDGINSHKAQTGFIVSVFLIILVGYVIWQKNIFIKDISTNYPFPKEFTIDQSTLVAFPGFKDDWVFTTNLSLEAINQYYLNPNNYQHWELISSNPIRLMQANEQLTINLFKSGQQTKIMANRRIFKDLK